MFRSPHVRYNDLTSNSSGIITHAQDDGSQTEVGNKVYINANINPNETGLPVSFLAQRNNDSMSFSWNRMKVINLSRQQKAVCTREQNKLTSLERHFARQSHLEQVKQSGLIDKFRQRLERLNELKASSTEQSNFANLRRFPLDYGSIETTEVTGSISQLSINPNSVYKATVESNRNPQTIKCGRIGKNNTKSVDLLSAVYNRRNFGYKTRGSPGTQATGFIGNYTSGGPILSDKEISVRQGEFHLPYQRYHERDKNRLIFNKECKLTLREVKNYETKSRLDNSKSDLVKTGTNIGANRNFIILEDKKDYKLTKNKSVRFAKEAAKRSGQNRLDPGGFRKLVQLTHRSRLSKGK